MGIEDGMEGSGGGTKITFKKKRARSRERGKYFGILGFDKRDL